MSTVCANCGFDNPPGMRFCGNCGTRLGETQASPSAAPAAPAAESNPFGPSFGTMIGADLAERLRRAGVEATGQRRNVTVLFADISGYTALSERIDSETIYSMIQEFIRVLSADVYKYEGVVDKITGDGLMALFGAPISHENNAERAIRSALDMQNDLHELRRKLQDEIGFNLEVHIGVHSGSVIVGGIGSDLMMNYTAIGDTVNLAHRIEEAAPPGAILISEAVYRQVRAIMDCQQISVLNPKGIAHPVVAYRVTGVKARPGLVRGIEGLSAPMVGRDLELRQLKQALADLTENGRGQFAIVTGEAGLGKSRLTAEFKALVDQSAVTVLEGQSLAYRRVSYWLIREVLYCYLELPSTTPPLQVRERLSRTVHQRLGLQAVEALSYLEHLMALPYSDASAAERIRRMDPSQLRQQIFLTVRDLLLVDIHVRPLLLILDDLHWADDASLDLLFFLLDSLRSEPIFILAISRQVQAGGLERVVNWASQNLGERFHRIPLQSLSRDQSKQLLALLLSIPALPEKLHDQILQRAAGVPFYLEEILRMLMDQNVIRNVSSQWQVVDGANAANLGVPDTLQELILARFDRLQPDHRRILQVASVIGKDFSLPVLGSVLPSADLSDLRSAVDLLIQRDFILPQPGSVDTEYTFRHVLMSDAIYGTMLRKDRSALHGRVAETIEQMFVDRLDEQVELLANHYRWSARSDRALHYTILAGQKATNTQVYQQSGQYYETALELMKGVDYSPLQAYQVYSGLGDAQLFFGEYPKARGYYQQALQALAPAGADQYIEERSSLYRRIARTHERQGDYDQALSRLDQAQQTLDISLADYPVERAQVWNDLAWIHYRRGNLIETQTLLLKALALVEPTEAYEVKASIYNRLGGVAFNQGEWELAADYLQKSIAIRESTRDLVNLATSLMNLGTLDLEMGKLDSALTHQKRGYEIKVRLGQAEGIALALSNLGWAHIQRGDLAEALAVLEKARSLTEQIGYSSLQRFILRNLGELNMAAEKWDQAQEYFVQYLRQLAGTGASESLGDSYRLLGEAALGANELDAALKWAKKAADVWDISAQSKKNITSTEWADYLRFRGMLATRQGDWSTALEYFHESRAVFKRLHSVLNEARVIYQMGCLAQMRGEREEGREAFASAAGTFHAVGARLDAQKAEQSLKSLSG